MTDDPYGAEQRTRDRRQQYELAEADAAQQRALARMEKARQEETAAEAAGYRQDGPDSPAPER